MLRQHIFIGYAFLLAHHEQRIHASPIKCFKFNSQLVERQPKLTPG